MGHIAKTPCVNVALNRNEPTAADSDIQITDLISVYREILLNKWVGPFTVQSLNGKTIHATFNGNLTQFSEYKVKIYEQPGGLVDGSAMAQA